MFTINWFHFCKPSHEVHYRSDDVDSVYSSDCGSEPCIDYEAMDFLDNPLPEEQDSLSVEELFILPEDSEVHNTRIVLHGVEITNSRDD